MGLFNFITLSRSHLEYPEKSYNQELVFYTNKSTLNLNRNFLHLKSSASPKISVHSSQNKNYCIASESIYRFSKLQYFNPVLLQELINQYWQQTIFLSVSNPTIQKYISQLSKQETLIAKNKKKKLLTDFSKALLNGHVDTNVVSSKTPKDLNRLFSLQYNWKKGLNFTGPKYLNGLWHNKKANHFPNKKQSMLLKILKKNNFPVFAVVNGFKQLIIAEPSDQLVHRNSLRNTLHAWYYDRFLWTKDIGGLYEGWFFINPKDAEEYRNYIQNKYSRSSKQHGLGISSSSIHFFYHLNRTAPPRTEFRLFPDLEEVANLLTSSEFKSNLVFDKNQKYGRSYFQGQPIYTIEPIKYNSKNYTKSMPLHYFYQIPGDKTQTKYSAVFLNKKTALQAWQKFCQSHLEYNLPAHPTLRIYNLEDFLKDKEIQDSIDRNKFLLIPGPDSYRYIENRYSNKNKLSNYKNIAQYSHSYLLTGKLWFQRVMWSLTSRQPPNW